MNDDIVGIVEEAVRLALTSASFRSTHVGPIAGSRVSIDPGTGLRCRRV